MDFSLNDDDLALRDAVQRFCEGEYPAPERGNAETPAQAAQRHAALAELGLLGLQIPAELGGSALGPQAAMLAAEQLGRALANGNWLSNAVLMAPLLAEAGSPAQRSAWLPALAAGRLQVALACAEPEARYDLADVRSRAKPTADGGWSLSGRKALVLGGDVADLLLVVARTDGERRDRSGLSLFAIDAASPGLTRRPITLLDGRRAAQLDLQGVSLAADRLVGPLDAALPLVERAVERANAALCAESAGALEALLAMTCEHLKTRRQFGAPLAKFQALQHRVADMATALEQLKSMACVAAMALEAEDASERTRLVSAAMTLTAQLGRQCGLTAIQLHGAMGMTDECRVGHYAKRLIANGLLFGDAAFHLAAFDAARRPTAADLDLTP
ncbi:acyl-CoA dehydrogenase family protein [Sphaerotilus microaerophilus]|uniref:Pimeloyl-CoA dehydrogenase small subunit n=1 Tax=Sphaerotilus microaerophilus TaxID=2914710 RepID=A0ABN6PMQ3_9BURK|nr:acyl-CoA dehydrogenase family protein [Sphaerotilus sp. FB-5]BDI06474.1 pimeloyl-CoA dehydrogenase small subunit [Sphaerotilus sp. FB-5]